MRKHINKCINIIIVSKTGCFSYIFVEYHVGVYNIFSRFYLFVHIFVSPINVVIICVVTFEHVYLSKSIRKSHRHRDVVYKTIAPSVAYQIVIFCYQEIIIEFNIDIRYAFYLMFKMSKNFVLESDPNIDFVTSLRFVFNFLNRL